MHFNYRMRCVNPDGTLDWERAEHNLIPDAGLEYMLRAALVGGTQHTQWYTGLVDIPVVPTAATTAADIPGAVREFTRYAGNRPAWQLQMAGASADNELNVAKFVVDADVAEVPIYGGFLINRDNKGTGGGLILSIARFPTPEVARGGQTLELVVDIDLRRDI